MNLRRILQVAFAAIIVAATAHGFGDPASKLPRSTPEEQGVSSAAILSFVEEAEQKIDSLHSFMLVRHGQVVAEGWWTPYSAEDPHTLQSLSKSFTSTAFALAAAEGKLSIDDPVIEFFPDEAPADPSKKLVSMRVRDLLRMSTGQGASEHQLNFGFPFRSKESLVKLFLELPVQNKPGTHFVYNSAATYVLSAIIQKATRQTVLDYLKPRLFEPLGITDPQWEASAQGVTFGGFGLSLRTEEIARFGQLYLQKGQWRGRQLIPAGYVEAATALQTANGSNPDSDWEQGYGYQFWRCRHGAYRADGAWGQFCVVMPEFDAVVVITGTYDNMQTALNLVWERILPGFKEDALPPNPDSLRKLTQKLGSLALKVPSGTPSAPPSAGISGRRFVFPENPQRIESIEFEPAQTGVDGAFLVRIAGEAQRVAYGHGAWKKAMLHPNAGSLVPMGLIAEETGQEIPIAVSGAWSGDNTFTVAICRPQTPFLSTYDMTFSGDELIVERKDATARSRPSVRLVGKAAR